MQHISTFAGLPAIEEPRAGIAVIGIAHGVSYEPGAPSHCLNAPAVVRAAARKYAAMLTHYDFDLGGPLLDGGAHRAYDRGDVPGDSGDPAGNQARATEAIRSLLDAGAIPVVIGGDDSVPIPFFRAYEGRGPLTVIQVDAHIDWRHEVNGITEGPSSPMRRASEMPWIDTLIQVGIRGVGSARPEDVAAARAYGAHLITASAVGEPGGMGRVLDLVPAGAPCLITLDCDGIDPSVLPAVKAPSPGGLTYRQVIDLIHGVTRKARVQGVDLVELMPERDRDGLSALTAARIVFNMVGALVRAGRLGEPL
jgi:agmatinase